MSFQTRTQFINKQASEKITLAHVRATARLISWSSEGAGVYSKVVPYFVDSIKMFDTSLTQVWTLGTIASGTFFYNIETSTLYIKNPASENPANEEMIVTYLFFFSNVTIDLPWSLVSDDDIVPYSGRILDAPAYKHKIGIDQGLASLVGSGSLVLANNDGHFDDKYDSLYFENQSVSIYSYNRDLTPEDAKLIFKGKITNKTFSAEEVTLHIKDAIFDFNQNVPQAVFDDTDNVNDSVKGNYKRWIYGKVDGLKLQSVDQIADGYTISGTVSSTNGVKEMIKFSNPTLNGTAIQGKYFKISTASNERKYYYYYGTSSSSPDPGPISGYESQKIEVLLADTAAEVLIKTLAELEVHFEKLVDYPGSEFIIQNADMGEAEDAVNVDAGLTISVLQQGANPQLVVGVGTSFLADLSPDDEITIGTQEFTVEEVINNTNIIISEPPAYPFTNLPISVVPELPSRYKNREFFVADHTCAELTKQIVSVKQFNRIELNNTDGLLAGDFVEFENGERIEIKSITQDNVIVLRKSLVQLPLVGEDVIRPPVQNVYIESKLIEPDNYTLNNGAELTVTLDSLAEFDLAPVRALTGSFTFTNGSRTITYSGSEKLTDLIESRDWIKPSGLTYSTYYEILSVTDTAVVIRTNFADTTVTSTASYKAPNYISDDTIISATVLGRTENGTSSGVWISTAAQAMRDVISTVGITDIDTASFDQGELDNPQIISLPIPFEIGSEGTAIKDVIDELSKSVLASLTLNNSLQIKYNALLAQIDDNIPTIDDNQLANWGIKAVNGNIYRTAVVKYRFKDVDRYTLETGNHAVSFSSDFVKNYIGTDKVSELELRLYNESDANMRAHREVYYNRLARSELTLESDLRLENYEIGDVVKVNIRRLYNRLGDNLTRHKVATITGKEVDGNKVILILSDLGNLYNISSVITPNTAPAYVSSTSDEKIKYGYITDAQGIVNADENTSNIHLIS